MKKTVLILLSICALAAATERRQAKAAPSADFRDDNAGIDMVFVQGGTFSMGCTGEHDNCDDDERPVRNVTLSDFYIGKYEVTQRQWVRVMGVNPSSWKDDNLPVDNVNWMDIHDFIERLNAMTGRRYRLPTEAEWEFAARGGTRSRGYIYSGSNHIDDVARYNGNSGSRNHAVGGKEPNELGIYDMSGNAWELVSDWHGTYSVSNETNPIGASSGSYRVFRGGSRGSGAWACRVSHRFDFFTPDIRSSSLGFRLALSPLAAVTERRQAEAAPRADFRDDNVGIDMVFVQGGTFSMGCSGVHKRNSGCFNNESPVRNVTVGDFYIGKYEVTQRQWIQVMGSNHSGFNEDLPVDRGGSWRDDLPVERVSWMDVQNFIERLNAMTGRRYRLPTEAEWEFAARGGTRSRGYIYSGSNHLDDVAWYDDNSGRRTHAVGGKEPNELGIHDMSGNVWEWVSDWYGTYSSSNETNPRGAASGSHRVNRGGSWFFDAQLCRVFYRLSTTPDIRNADLGFRLVLSPQ